MSKSNRPNRSDAYQYKICEVNASTEFLASFSNGESMNPSNYSEDYLELQDQLKLRTRQVMQQVLTERQRNIVFLYYDGYTQLEIAKILDINQSSVTKSLNGNSDYKDGNRKVYGGTIKKLRKIFLADPEIVEILRKMDDLESHEKL